MKCPFCNEEISDDVRVCPHCNAPVGQDGTEETASLSDAIDRKEEEASPSGSDSPSGAPGVGGFQAQPPLPEEKKKGKGKWIALGAAAVAVCGIGAAAILMNAKSPKEKVIDAFEQAFSKEGQVSPGEEIFGWSQLAQTMGSEDIQEGFELTLSGSSLPELDPFRDSGLKLAAKSSPSAQRAALNMGLIFGGMDLVDLDVYYGEEKMLLSIPQLSSNVFLFDISDGLAERMADSPFFGPLMEQNGFDAEAYAALMERASQQAGDGGSQPFDLEALMNRYREGCQAKAKFQEALTVEKGEKQSFTVNGQETSCQGYHTFVSKDSMIAFLRESSDFFLQDETLRDDFIRQLQMTADINAMMGVQTLDADGSDISSPEEMAAETYENMEEQVDALIDILDQSMSDVDMEVYLTKKGELASFSGTTAITDEDRVVDVTFSLKLQGGAYRLQNMEAVIDLASDGEHVSLNLLRSGTYDETVLTDDISIDLGVPGQSFGGTYTSTYQIQDGSFHIQLEARSDRTKVGALSLTGTVDKLEKGKSFHAELEELRMEESFAGQYITLAGEVYVEPLEGTIEAISGETFDMVQASQMEWMGVAMEILEKGQALMNSLEME